MAVADTVKTHFANLLPLHFCHFASLQTKNTFQMTI
nr:MAG TPA: hypothetical protein [Caudoviricetes sp.]